MWDFMILLLTVTFTVRIRFHEQNYKNLKPSRFYLLSGFSKQKMLDARQFFI